MWRVDHLHSLSLALQLAAGEACKGTALGAMAVQHVDAELRGEFCDPGRRAPIAESQLARHGHACEPEGTVILKTAELYGNLVAARTGIADDAHLGSESRLAEREVVHVAEEAAHRQAHAMEDS